MKPFHTFLTVILLALMPSAAVAMGLATLTASATVLSKSQCRFNTASVTLDFGALEPTAPTDKSSSTPLDFVCRGSANPATFFISMDNGLHDGGTGQKKMRHTAVPSGYIAYGLSLSPASATVPRNAPQALTITGTVLSNAYRTAPAGNYSDTVVITIAP